MLKRKNALSGIDDVDKKRNTVVGYASKFGNIDSHNDIVERGAFKRTINHNAARVKTLMHHDPMQVVGKPKMMEEDEYGLYTETKVSDTAMGRDLLTLIEDGVIDEMSIGFIPVKENYDDKRKANVINEVKLVEYSFVTLASNPAARVEGLKGLAAIDEITSSMKRMEKALRDGEFVSDDLPERLEFAVKYWRQVIEASKSDSFGVSDGVELVSEPSEDSAVATPQGADDSADATRDVMKALDGWREEYELLQGIESLAKNL
jgi:HK97 family phage prohead protease